MSVASRWPIDRVTHATLDGTDRVSDRPARCIAGDLNADPAAASVRFWTGRRSLDGSSVCYQDA